MASPSTVPRSSNLKVLGACISGTFVEWFDFALYGFSAATLAIVFFPEGNEGAALLGVVAIYGVTFVFRPLGGFFFGRLGDRLGRRSALSLSIVLMGVGTAGVGLLPGYETAGVLAPILLTVCRLLQGFAASGELTGAATFAAEYAPARRRGLFVNFVVSFGSIGTAGGTLVVLLFQLAPDTYAAGGWRAPFIIGGVLSLVGVYLRLRVEETPVFKEITKERSEQAAKAPPLRQVVRGHVRHMIVVFAIYTFAGIGFQTLAGYMPIYLTQSVGVSATVASAVGAGTFLLYAAVAILVGWLTDRVGRRRFVLFGVGASLVLMIPSYLLLGTGSLLAICLGQLFLLVPLATQQGGTSITVLELFPAGVRYTAVVIPYALAYAIFAGTAPLVTDLLVQAGGSLMPAVYGTVVAAIVLPVVLLGLPETRGSSARHGLPAATNERADRT